MLVTVNVRCNHGIRMSQDVEVPSWANFVAVDECGSIWGYENRPKINSSASWWWDDDKSESIDDFDRHREWREDCSIANWKETLIEVERLEQVAGPYVGKTIAFIRDVRKATGASLWLSKWAVDCALAAGRSGTWEDYFETVRFIVDGVAKHEFTLDGPEYKSEFNEARDFLKNGYQPNSLVQFTLDFWIKGDND